MRFSWPLAVLFVLGGIAVKAGFLTGALLACAVWALVGPRQTIQALALATVLTYANPQLAAAQEYSGVLDRLVMLCAALRVLPFMRAADLRLLWPLWLFSLVAALTSAIASAALAISIMKVITVVVSVSTVVVAFGALTGPQMVRMRDWMLTLAWVIVALSAATLLNPQMAYALNGRGLQGILSHPQSLGTLLAPFAAWWVASMMLSRNRFQLLTAATAVLFAVVTLLTEARSAAVAITLGVLAALLTRLLRGRVASQAPVSQIVWTSALGVVVLLLVSLTTGKLISSMFSDFVFKRSADMALSAEQPSTVSQAFLESRGYNVISQWNNFRSAPLTGHGFGVYADGISPLGVTEYAGIPISAPVEKGFIPTAVLEETGLIGGLLFFFTIFWFARQVWRNSDLRWIAMFVTAISINLGEAVILSPGGIGIIIWLAIGLSCCANRIPETRTQALRPTTPSDLTVRAAQGAVVS